MSRQPGHTFEIYLESGARRTFAAALGWPGWCRMGRDEAAALTGLLAAGPRYARVLRSTKLGFRAPADSSALVITERLAGSATTDFGAPDRIPACDTQPLAEPDLGRLEAILKACWRAMDAVVDQAQGQALRPGPRGGGRSLVGIVEHVLGAEASYLAQLGGRAPANSPPSPAPLREAILKTLAAAAQGEIAPYGPRGGKRWPPRYFVRRAAWHILDHVWEIEDRLEDRAA